MDDTGAEEKDITPPSGTPPGRTFVSTGEGLTLLEQVSWTSRNLRALLSAALDDERLAGAGAFAVVHGRSPGTYTARLLGTVAPHIAVVLKVVLWEGHWIAIGPAGTEPREVFRDGTSAAWDGPVPVQALP